MNAFAKFMLMTTLPLTSMWATSITICKGCHGQAWEKSAMGKSKKLKDMSKEEIFNALQSYKEGTYGGVMKGLMVEQVKDLSMEDMEALAIEIKK